jgi:transposase, IS30 family
MSHRQLTLEERYHIQLLHKQHSRSEIARTLGRHRSSVSRELRRNSEPDATQPYLAARASRLSHQRRIAKGRASRKIQGPLQELVERKLRLSWSPEQISGRLKQELGIQISHETIYQHVLRDSKARGFLRYCLRFGGYKHHRFKKSRMAERTRQRKNWMETRPPAANDRSELGHWERDCIVGKHGGAALLTLVDRRARYTRIRRVERHNAAEVAQATVDALKPHRDVTKTVTNDNGSEFQRDQTLQRQLGVPIFFTEPSAPWQRGSIENLNGLVRQYVRKGSRIEELPDDVPSALEETLNFRPRKILGYRTPHEIFFDEEVCLLKGQLMHFGLEFSSPT